jgi:hypothetical protein
MSHQSLKLGDNLRKQAVIIFVVGIVFLLVDANTSWFLTDAHFNEHMGIMWENLHGMSIAGAFGAVLTGFAMMFGGILLHQKFHNHSSAILRHFFRNGGGLVTTAILMVPLIGAGIQSNVLPESFQSIEHAIHDFVVFGWIPFYIMMAVLESLPKPGEVVTMSPILAALAGVVVPVCLYSFLSFVVFPEAGMNFDGSAVVTATDVVFSRSMLALMGAAAGVVIYLLRIAVIDDVLGLVYLTGIQIIALIQAGGDIEFVALRIGILIGGNFMAYLVASIMTRRNASLVWYLVPMLIGFMSFWFTGFEPILAYAAVVIGLRKNHELVHTLEGGLLVSTQPILFLFAYVTGALYLDQWNIKSTITIVSLVGGKLVGVGGTLWLMKHRGVADLQGITFNQIIQIASASTVGFKVAAINASVVYAANVVKAIYLATNATILFGFMTVAWYWLQVYWFYIVLTVYWNDKSPQMDIIREEMRHPGVLRADEIDALNELWKEFKKVYNKRRESGINKLPTPKIPTSLL